MAITKCRGRGHRRNCRVAVAFSVAVLGIVPHWKPDSYALVDVGSVGALRCAVSGGADPPIVSRPQTRQASEIIPALISGELARKQVFAFVDRLSGAIAELGSLSDSPRRAETAQ
jgi:hypothetical protein